MGGGVKGLSVNNRSAEGRMHMGQNLERFLSAQQNCYKDALEEIQQGRKRSHWMWFIFPQIIGLGHSPTARYYSIKDLQEAKAFLEDEILGKNLIRISEALLDIESNDAEEVMGWPDNMKLKSSMTLFLTADPQCSVFQKVLDKFFNGEKDFQTIKILEKMEL